jgi:hypothetical protein
MTLKFERTFFITVKLCKGILLVLKNFDKPAKLVFLHMRPGSSGQQKRASQMDSMD